LLTLALLVDVVVGVHRSLALVWGIVLTVLFLSVPVLDSVGR
jgi:hypothetical protein